ncbi:MAG: Rid family detoxifying hydrolase [Usitatibacter sp.]
MKAGSKRVVALMAAGVVVAGCGMMGGGGGRSWVPQGSGDIPEAREAPRRAPAPVAQADTRSSGVGATRQSSATASADPPSVPGAYTQATRYGDLLFVSGQIGMDLRSNQMVGDKVEDQTRRALENVRAVLEAHRLTMTNVVSVTIYMKDLAQFRVMDDVYETFFRANLPSRSVVEVARLPRGAAVEIAVIAGR